MWYSIYQASSSGNPSKPSDSDHLFGCAVYEQSWNYDGVWSWGSCMVYKGKSYDPVELYDVEQDIAWTYTGIGFQDSAVSSTAYATASAEDTTIPTIDVYVYRINGAKWKAMSYENQRKTYYGCVIDWSTSGFDF